MCDYGPYKGALCLHGHGYEARAQILRVVAARQRMANVSKSRKTQHECLLCGAPLLYSEGEMHQGCTNRVMGRLKTLRASGAMVKPEHVIRLLIEEDRDSPPDGVIF